MAEGRSYRCKWEKTANGFTVWVAKRPRLRGRGRLLQDALEDLASAICDATGDGEPCMSLFPLPPPHPADAPWIAPEWCRLSGNGGVVVAGNGEGLFSRGWCMQCGRPRGQRTDKPLEAKRPGEGDVGTPWWNHGRNGIDYGPVLVSERFKGLLSTAESRCCEWRQVQMPRRCRTRYFECVPRRFIREVAVRGWTTDGWRCPVCKDEFILCSPSGRITWDGGEVHSWYSRSALRDRDKLVGVGVGFQSLIVPIRRGAKLIDSPGSKGLRIEAVGLVPASMVRQRARLPALKQSRAEQEEDLRKWVHSL